MWDLGPGVRDEHLDWDRAMRPVHCRSVPGDSRNSTRTPRGSALICRRQNWSREETTMNRAILGTTLAGALVLVTSICWMQSWAQDQGRPPAPPALVGMGLPEVPPEQVGMSKQKLDRIHDALKQHVADGKLPGAVVLVARKGKLIYADVTGFQDKDEGKPMALDSLFRIYSMTKPLVSVAAMMLVEDGTIQLTDPVSKFFPAFKGQQVSVARSDNELARMSYITVAAEREMTVQDLLRHTAGLAYGEITVNAPVRDAYAKAGLYLAGVRDYDARELTSAEEVERLAKAPLAHQPGTVWEYSMAVDLLGRVVEAASGKRRAGVADGRVFKPLKMRDTAFWVSPGKTSRLAQPLAVALASGQPIKVIDVSKEPKNDSGGAGAVATAAMSSSRWPRSPSHGKCSRRFCGSSRNCGRSHHQRRREAFDGYAFRATDRRSASKCQGKWPDQTLD